MGFFKAYDMRGTFGVDFDLATVRGIGAALPQVVRGRRWLVGRDCRTTSAAVRDALVAGLCEAGADVTDLGLCTTPMVYFFTAADGYDGSVMITASHNPPSDNGLKVSMKTALPVGYANGLAQVEAIVRGTFAAPGAGVGREPGAGEPLEGQLRGKYAAQPDALRNQGAAPGAEGADAAALKRYCDWMRERGKSAATCGGTAAPCGKSAAPCGGTAATCGGSAAGDGGCVAAHPCAAKAPRFGIDCSNGMASLLARELFPGAVVINDTLDGRFPSHSPNPLDASARAQISELVRREGLDFGIIFDGDADRAMFVNERGEFVQPDYLIPVVARATVGADARGRRIIHDVRTSRGAIEALREMGAEPLMVPVGHAFAKPILRREKAACGGELAGHYYFEEFFGCDSGALAALRVVAEFALAKAEGKTFSEMMAPVTGSYSNSGEMNFKVAEKDAAIARVLGVAAAKLPREVARSEMDGIRVEYAEGWINIRKSNTEPYLRLIVECDSRERRDEWVALLSAAIRTGE